MHYIAINGRIRERKHVSEIMLSLKELSNKPVEI